MWWFNRKKRSSELQKFINEVCLTRKQDYTVVTHCSDKSVGIARSLVFNVLFYSEEFVNDLINESKGQTKSSLETMKDDLVMEVAIFTCFSLKSRRDVETHIVQEKYENLRKEWKDGLYSCVSLTGSVLGAFTAEFFDQKIDEMNKVIHGRINRYLIKRTLKEDVFAEAISNIAFTAERGLLAQRNEKRDVQLDPQFLILLPMIFNSYVSHMIGGIYGVAQNLYKHTFPNEPNDVN